MSKVLLTVPPVPVAEVVTGTDHWWVGFILCPLISLLLCGLCAACKVKTKLPAWITVASLACSFVLTLLLANHRTRAHRLNGSMSTGRADRSSRTPRSTSIRCPCSGCVS